MRNSTTASSQIRSDIPVYHTPERTVRGHIYKKQKIQKTPQSIISQCFAAFYDQAGRHVSRYGLRIDMKSSYKSAIPYVFRDTGADTDRVKQER